MIWNINLNNQESYFKMYKKKFCYTVSGTKVFFYIYILLLFATPVSKNVDERKTCALFTADCKQIFSLSLWSAEVQIKVQVFDNSDLSPLADAEVKVHGNQTVLASDRAGGDGTVRVSFLYRAGTRVIITASKQDYVTNSVPWHSSRIPCKSLLVYIRYTDFRVFRYNKSSKKIRWRSLIPAFHFFFLVYASVSLYLLAQRPGTLILYDDILQVLSGSPGKKQKIICNKAPGSICTFSQVFTKASEVQIYICYSNKSVVFSSGSQNQPLVQLQRKSLQLPPSSNYTALSASLTTARTQYEIGGFPFLLGLETNSSG